jgi:hypothetical protein
MTRSLLDITRDMEALDALLVEVEGEVPARKEIDRDAIRLAIDASETVAGAHLGERGRRLNIR